MTLIDTDELKEYIYTNHCHQEEINLSLLKLIDDEKINTSTKIDKLENSVTKICETLNQIEVRIKNLEKNLMWVHEDSDVSQDNNKKSLPPPPPPDSEKMDIIRNAKGDDLNLKIFLGIMLVLIICVSVFLIMEANK